MLSKIVLFIPMLIRALIGGGQLPSKPGLLDTVTQTKTGSWSLLAILGAALYVIGQIQGHQMEWNNETASLLAALGAGFISWLSQRQAVAKVSAK